MSGQAILKRWKLITACSLLLLISAASIAISWMADSRLRNLIEIYRAAGEPVSLADFQSKTVPPINSEMPLLQRAANASSISKDDDQFLDKHNSTQLPLRDDEMRLIEWIVAANRAALNDLRQARLAGKHDWPLPQVPSVSAVRGVGMSFQSYRSLASVARYAALLAHQRGDDLESIRLLRDILFEGESVHYALPSMISPIYGEAMSNLCTYGIMEISPDLRPEAREEIKLLIGELLDQSAGDFGWKNGLNGERAALLDQAQPLFARTIWGTLYKLDVSRIIAFTTRFRDGALAPDLPAARAIMPRVAIPPQLLTDLRRAMPNYPSMVTNHFVMLATRRATAIALAIRLYRLDNDNAWPDKLTDLVPTYLPKLPTDPLAGEGHDFTYTHADPQPAVYSILLSTPPSQPSRINPKKPPPPGTVVVYLLRQPKPEPDSENQ